MEKDDGLGRWKGKLGDAISTSACQEWRGRKCHEYDDVHMNENG